MEEAKHDLTCPITLDPFEDPVTVPCCGKSFSRDPLSMHLQRSDRCPSCNGDLSSFDVVNAAKNVLLAGLVETFYGVRVASQQGPQWSCEAFPIKSGSQVYEVELSVKQAKYSLRPVLFIAVMDCSGSMSGRPYEQVRTALKHIYAMARQHDQVKLIMLSYGSDCTEIQTPEQYRIHGGTNFVAAFDCVGGVLNRYTCSEDTEVAHKLNNVSSAHLVFMTDGEDMSGMPQDELVTYFKDMLNECWSQGPLSVHTVAFGRSFNRSLLEQMRTAGPQEGTFRFASYEDEGDTLCGKLTSLFTFVSSSTSVNMKVAWSDQKEEEESVLFPINRFGSGQVKHWSFEKLNQVKVWTPQGLVTLDVTLKDPKEETLHHYLTYQTDQLTQELLDMPEDMNSEVKQLKILVFRKKLKTLRQENVDEELESRLSYLSEQVHILEKGKALDLNRLNDLRFSSLFGKDKKEVVESKSSADHIQSTYADQKLLGEQPYMEPPLKTYSRNNEGKNRNTLQEAICTLNTNCLTPTIQTLIQHATEEDLWHEDVDGNNTQHLVCYCGHSNVVKALMSKFPDVSWTKPNRDEETPVTLSIKKRGFFLTLGLLLDQGVTIPRVKPMERFCLDQGWVRTAKIVSKFGDGSLNVDISMSWDTVNFVYERALQSGPPREQEELKSKWSSQEFLEVALHHKQMEVAQELIQKWSAELTLKQFADYCLPKKPDAPDTADYLQKAQWALKMKPSLLEERIDPEGDTALILAVRKGSLPHCEWLLQVGARLEDTNDKGNTPLWIACFYRWPCIIDLLLDHGADINKVNLKGNPPLYGVCSRGNIKVTEQLLQRGADPTLKNTNGDTMILICCRNNQYEVLQELLKFVPRSLVSFRAHIDGFNAMMASAEQDRPECIRVLFEYGLDLNECTDVHNEILEGATSLHIAAYYGCYKALCKLIELGANIHARDPYGQTPLHLAIIQSRIEVVRALLRHGARLNDRDDFGNTPLTYCQGNKDMTALLIDPLNEYLVKLIQTSDLNDERINGKEELPDTVSNIKGIPGLLTVENILDCSNVKGMTPLAYAVLFGRYEWTQLLMEKGCSISMHDFYGWSPYRWSRVLNNYRLKELFIEDKEDDKYMTDETLKAWNDQRILFMGIPPQKYVSSDTSGINERMTMLLQGPMEQPVCVDQKEGDPQLVRLTYGFQTNYTKKEPEWFPSRWWDAKILTWQLCPATITRHHLTVYQVMSLALYTNNPFMADLLNTALMTRQLSDELSLFQKVLHSALQLLPNHEGEVYIGTTKDIRSLYQEGQTFFWNHYQSASTLWKVAMNNTPHFDTGTKRGTILIFKTKKGKVVNQYSEYGSNEEVIIPPGNRYWVKRWYHGSVIALGQPNIREHTFGVKEQDSERLDMSQMKRNDKSLIIELIEL